MFLNASGILVPLYYAFWDRIVRITQYIQDKDTDLEQ